jgi:hypothetical protein
LTLAIEKSELPGAPPFLEPPWADMGVAIAPNKKSQSIMTQPISVVSIEKEFQLSSFGSNDEQSKS